MGSCQPLSGVWCQPLIRVLGSAVSLVIRGVGASGKLWGLAQQSELGGEGAGFREGLVSLVSLLAGGAGVRERL